MFKLTKATVANAVKADNRTSFIKEKFVGLGVFTRAEALYSKTTGAHGIGFDFKANDGAKTSFSLWTHNDAGDQWSSFDIVMAMLAVLGHFDELEAKPLRSIIWDREKKENVDATLQQYAPLVQEEIGVLIRMAEENRQDGQGTFWKSELVGVYRAKDDLTASEIIAKKTVPEKLEQLITALKDKPLKGGTAKKGGNGGHPNAPGNSGGFPEDDIPF